MLHATIIGKILGLSYVTNNRLAYDYYYFTRQSKKELSGFE